MAETLLCIGTRKGLFLARSEDRAAWKIDGPHFKSDAVYSVAVDTRGGRVRVLAGADSTHWGPSVFHSDDLGASWHEATEAPVRFPAEIDASVARVWQLSPAGENAPGVVWAGAEPHSLWKSEDGGETYNLVKGLWEHPHHAEWQPGGGGACLHTVLPDPEDPEKLLVALSAGGAYRSADGGRSWEASNTGITVNFLPDPEPEFGQCVHKIAPAAGRDGRYYLQHHWGVYRSDDDGHTWQNIGEGLPSDFGFAVCAHPRRRDTAYVFPLNGDYDRVPAERKCRVYRTDDAGATWQPLTRGLPGEHHGVVLRDAMTVDAEDPMGIYFGTRNGEVWASADEGEHWDEVASHLADVLVVRAVRIG